MQIANCRLIIHDNGNDVAKPMVTPAEVAVLRRMFTSVAKKDPITDLKILPGEAASFDKPAVYYDNDEFDDAGNKVIHRTGDLKTKATYRARTDAEELARLRRKYHKSVLDQLFQGLNPVLPKTFDEVKAEPLTQDQRPMDAVWTEEATFTGKPIDKTPVKQQTQQQQVLATDDPKAPRNAEGLLLNGPTLDEYVKAGYKAETYPPQGYAKKP